MPDSVANLMKRNPDGTLSPYGEEGRNALRTQIMAMHKDLGTIGGASHVLKGQASFGVANAIVGASVGMDARSGLETIPIGVVTSATAGCTNGALAGFDMVAARIDVPDPRHNDPTTPAPMVSLCPFKAAAPLPAPDRFTGKTAVQTTKNLTEGLGDRAVVMTKSTLPLTAAAIAARSLAALVPGPDGPLRQFAHRAMESTARGVGTGGSIASYYGEQGRVLNNDKDRIERRGAGTDPERGAEPGLEMTPPTRTGQNAPTTQADESSQQSSDDENNTTPAR